LQEECEREISLIQDLLDLQYLEAGSRPLVITTISLHDVVPHLLEAFEPRMHGQQQILNLQLATDLPLISTDFSSFSQIFTELLNNACKYTPSGKTITVNVSVINDTLHLMISNSGVEIPAKELPQIFDKFYRIPNNDPWKHGGTGLGLALVKKLLEPLQGNVRATSGNGTTCFVIQLPFQTPENPHAKDPSTIDGV